MPRNQRASLPAEAGDSNPATVPRVPDLPRSCNSVKNPRGQTSPTDAPRGRPPQHPQPFARRQSAKIDHHAATRAAGLLRRVDRHSQRRGLALSGLPPRPSHGATRVCVAIPLGAASTGHRRRRGQIAVGQHRARRDPVNCHGAASSGRTARGRQIADTGASYGSTARVPGTPNIASY